MKIGSARGILVGAIVLFAVACGGATDWHTQAVNGPGISVSPIRVWNASGKLWFRTNVQNGGPVPILVDRDAMTLTLSTGQTLHRAQGSFGSAHTPYVIAPGASHLLYVEFAGDGVDWAAVQNAQLNLAGAISANGQPIAMPPMVVAP